MDVRQHPNYARVTTQDGVRNVPQLRRSLPQQNFNRTPRGACYNCKRTGHYASACRMPRQCYNCGQKGHISKFCKQINQLINSEIDSNESSAGMRYDEEFPVLSVSNKFKDLTDENDIHGTIEEEVCLTDFEVRPKKQKAMWKRTQQKKSKSQYEQESTFIEKQVAFIEGRGPRPEQCSSAKKQNFLNKPVVKCRINGDQRNTLMDTGATCNIIAKELFDELKQKDNCKLLETRNRISCANNSSMNCHGEVGLHFSLAGRTILVKFFVVDGLKNSQVIVGLRTMKRLGIKFDF